MDFRTLNMIFFFFLHGTKNLGVVAPEHHMAGVRKIHFVLTILYYIYNYVVHTKINLLYD